MINITVQKGISLKLKSVNFGVIVENNVTTVHLREPEKHFTEVIITINVLAEY